LRFWLAQVWDRFRIYVCIRSKEPVFADRNENQGEFTRPARPAAGSLEESTCTIFFVTEFKV